MAAPVNHWKLGVFVLIVFAAVVGAAIGIGECSTHHATVAFTTYFDESVGGIETGGRVEFRGVTVGSVSRIAIAPDHRHVEVRSDLDVDALPKMGIVPAGQDGGARYRVPPDLRAQVGGNGLTGVKYVSLDLLDPNEHPPPALTFAVPASYIPAATSTMKSLEDALTETADAVPAIVASVATASGRVDRMLGQLERAGVSDKAAATLEHADAALAALEVTMRRFDRAGVPEKTSKALEQVRAAVAKVDGVLDRLDGDGGLIASVGRATDAFGQVGRRVSSSTRDVDEALDELRDAAEAIRLLAEDLDRDPDMLLKGRRTGRSR